MRVGGLATGMDTEAIIKKLMDAERIPLVKMEQNRTQLEWKRDAFRDINSSLLELENLMRDMKYSKTYQSKTVTSSQAGAVTATGSTTSANGSYKIEVTELATSAMNVGKLKDGLNINDKPSNVVDGKVTFSTYDDAGVEVKHEIEVKDSDTIKDVLKKINDGDNNVRAFYNEQSNQVVLETTRTGNYNVNEDGTKRGPEITFDDAFFTDTLGLENKLNTGSSDTGGETGGTNAKFTYNDGLELTSKDNSYTLNGLTFQFHSVTDGAATLTVANDVDASFNAITKFVDKYNEVVDKINKSQTEEKFRDFKPLTDEEKKGMSEDEIKKWEEKAQSGILRRESSLTNGAFNMRSAWYANVETGGAFTSLTQIGITTTMNYMDGGKLEINEEQLRKALQDNPDDVQKLFSDPSEGSSRGIVYRLESALKDTMGKIEEQAGKSTHTLDNYTLGKRMKDLNDRIRMFELRMEKVENRHWNQFTQMEKAIQRMNDQSSQLFSQFG